MAERGSLTSVSQSRYECARCAHGHAIPASEVRAFTELTAYRRAIGASDGQSPDPCGAAVPEYRIPTMSTIRSKAGYDAHSRRAGREQSRSTSDISTHTSVASRLLDFIVPPRCDGVSFHEGRGPAQGSSWVSSAPAQRRPRSQDCRPALRARFHSVSLLLLRRRAGPRRRHRRRRCGPSFFRRGGSRGLGAGAGRG